MDIQSSALITFGYFEILFLFGAISWNVFTLSSFKEHYHSIVDPKYRYFRAPFEAVLTAFKNVGSNFIQLFGRHKDVGYSKLGQDMPSDDKVDYFPIPKLKDGRKELFLQMLKSISPYEADYLMNVLCVGRWMYLENGGQTGGDFDRLLSFYDGVVVEDDSDDDEPQAEGKVFVDRSIGAHGPAIRKHYISFPGVKDVYYY
ncbi:hypothetical protein RF11_13293 [Thelohanellus kitauei]|uniref:Uncharacterized protein n=1 Tax=Thelohanellus kitauei TaxID=669202 RepID=A0A0C2NGP0_THEKT|nr:hypothetical protein RF11_13293 [Thelohanellus kitauei]